MVDLLFTNAQLIDGTGAPGYRASGAVIGDTIEIVTGDVSATTPPGSSTLADTSSAPVSSTCTLIPT